MGEINHFDVWLRIDCFLGTCVIGATKQVAISDPALRWTWLHVAKSSLVVLQAALIPPQAHVRGCSQSHAAALSAQRRNWNTQEILF